MRPLIGFAPERNSSHESHAPDPFRRSSPRSRVVAARSTQTSRHRYSFRRQTMNKGTAIVGFFMSFLAGIFLMWGIERGKVGIGPEETSAGGGDHSAAVIPVSDKDPTWGDGNAPVTLVIFSDFQCPFCTRVEPTIKQLKDKYGKDKLRVVWKNQPLSFHQNARPAAEAAATVHGLAGSDAFWKFHELAFKNQQSLTEENYAKWAAESGVDAAKFKAAYQGKKYASKVDEDMALANKVGATGTPAFRINGATLVGAQPAAEFEKIIDAQLAEAKKLVAAGTKASDVYIELTKKNAQISPDQANPQQQQQNKPQEPPEDTAIWKVPIYSDDPMLGPKDALVTIVEFSDFQCPFCKRVEDTMRQVVSKYGNDVRVV
jgi:protein-disulfide isomerase